MPIATSSRPKGGCVEVASLVRGSRDDVEDKVARCSTAAASSRRTSRSSRTSSRGGQGQDLAAAAEAVKGVQVVATVVDGADAASLRNAIDQLKSRLNTAAIVLGSVDTEGRITLIAGVTADVLNRIRAAISSITSPASRRPRRWPGRSAQAGGNEPAKLPAALQSVAGWVAAKPVEPAVSAARSRPTPSMRCDLRRPSQSHSHSVMRSGRRQ